MLLANKAVLAITLLLVMVRVGFSLNELKKEHIMFHSSLVKPIKASLLAVIIMTCSVSAQADNLAQADLPLSLQQHITAQMQVMMHQARRELSMSVQAQISEMMFDAGINSAVIADKQGCDESKPAEMSVRVTK